MTADELRRLYDVVLSAMRLAATGTCFRDTTVVIPAPPDVVVDVEGPATHWTPTLEARTHSCKKVTFSHAARDVAAAGEWCATWIAKHSARLARTEHVVHLMSIIFDKEASTVNVAMFQHRCDAEIRHLAGGLCLGSFGQHVDSEAFQDSFIEAADDRCMRFHPSTWGYVLRLNGDDWGASRSLDALTDAVSREEENMPCLDDDDLGCYIIEVHRHAFECEKSHTPNVFCDGCM